MPHHQHNAASFNHLRIHRPFANNTIFLSISASKTKRKILFLDRHCRQPQILQNPILGRFEMAFASSYSSAKALQTAAVSFDARCRKSSFVSGVSRIPISAPLEVGRLCISLVSGAVSSRRVDQVRCMAVVDQRLIPIPNLPTPADVLGYELVQGTLVEQASVTGKSIQDAPTAVLLHGILGSRKNWGTFAKRLAKEFPNWQFLLVDLRCHGDSASIKKRGPHTVASAALDVLKLVRQLRITPRVLVGHSFGGKVALSMVEQAAKPLARPVKVWVLDATPGIVQAGGDGEDHPGELISFLSNTFPKEVSSKRVVIDALLEKGFSKDVAQWVVTNLRQTKTSGSTAAKFTWIFDLNGIADMYKSYEETNLWEIVEDIPRGVHVNFLKAERSLHRWALEDLRRIHAAEEIAIEEGGGVGMHVLEDAGHWVHADNPDGLFRILSSSFEGQRL